MNSNSNHGPGHPHHPHDHDHPCDGHDHGHKVTVSLGDQSKEVEKGVYTVIQIKDWFSVPHGDALEVVDDGKLVALADDGSFAINCDTKFFACPRVGASA